MKNLPITANRHESFYTEIGGEDFFRTLVSHFYQGVRSDESMWQMYPEARKEAFSQQQGKNPSEGAEHRLATFLMQYWGGPKTYSLERGHPRLRMRHAPFAVTESAKDAWLKHMKKALELSAGEFNTPLNLQEILWDYLERAAISLINTHDGSQAPLAGQSLPDYLP